MLLKSLPVTLKIESGVQGKIKMIGNDLSIHKESVGDGMFFIYADKGQLHQRKNNIEIGVYSNGKKVSNIKTTFFAPNE